MEPAFRIAEEPDTELLLEFMREFYEYDRIPFDVQVARSALRGIINDGSRGRVWLIHLGGGPVGYAVLTLGYSLEFHGRDAILDELFIREPHRGRGAGKQTLKFIESACGELGVRALHLVVGRENIKAQSFYRKIGFQAQDRYLMTKWVAPETIKERD
ncbi:MAG TPA: GNAT family N-acetyltransferase [Blastocatellia bacterium]|nr:GNAT family N-acetyltransferase [Blastocatellia bacterium]